MKYFNSYVMETSAGRDEVSSETNAFIQWPSINPRIALPEQTFPNQALESSEGQTKQRQTHRLYAGKETIDCVAAGKLMLFPFLNQHQWHCVIKHVLGFCGSFCQKALAPSLELFASFSF